MCLVYVGRVSTTQVPQRHSFEMPDTSGMHSLLFTRVKPQQFCALTGQEENPLLELLRTAGGGTISDLKFHSRTILIKPAWYSHKKTH